MSRQNCSSMNSLFSNFSSIASFVRDLSQHARSQVIAKLESSQSVFRDDPQLLAPLSTILRFILVNAKSDAVLDS